jgi:hypothetical protein
MQTAFRLISTDAAPAVGLTLSVTLSVTDQSSTACLTAYLTMMSP